jgi:hypothetical protein
LIIEFPKLSNVFFKPIVTVELLKKDKVVDSLIFNTLLKRKSPHLYYTLLPNSDQSYLKIYGSSKNYELSLKVIDFLAN